MTLRVNLQGSDSGSLAGLRDSPNRTSKNVQKCTESMPISATKFRWGTSTLEANEKLKVNKSEQLFSGGVRGLWVLKKCTKGTKSKLPAIGSSVSSVLLTWGGFTF